MALERKFKKDKEIIFEYDSFVKDIRQQLCDQLKNLDTRLETHLSMLLELHDFYKRRAEVELEHSKNLDRLVKQIMLRHKAEKQRRDLWPGYSTYTCWQSLLETTMRKSKDHEIVSNLYSTQIAGRISELMDDLQRIYRKCREIAFNCHEELMRVLNELQSAMKTYHIYHGESKLAEQKLKSVETQMQKVEQHTAKRTFSKKFRTYEKQSEKKQAKYTESKLKALKSRNEYLLCTDAANAAIQKYFVDDLPDLIDCMDYGYHNTLGRAMLMHISVENCLAQSQRACVDQLNKCVTELDQRADKQRLVELASHCFSLPKKLDFQSHKGDEVCQISAQMPVQEELIDRLHHLYSRLDALKLQNEEDWKTLETVDSSWMEMITLKDYDVSKIFAEDRHAPKSPVDVAKRRSDRIETETYYISKFGEYTLGKNLIARLQAKLNGIQKALCEGSYEDVVGLRPPSLPPKPKKRRIGKAPLVGQPRLFGGSIEEYVEATGHDIPAVVMSCIRVINLHGMHHQGVFRVSGSQHEINELKNHFERGEDPLVDMVDGNDINSVAGVLKLYFRELGVPIFPVQMFDQLISCSQLEDTTVMIERIKELMSTLPRAIVIVLRYLAAFLAHLSEYSDENMMDPYNLAICFGPTLMPIPADRDQVHYHSYVNELIKNIIAHHEHIFCNDGGIVYEKCILQADEDREEDGLLENLSEDEDDDLVDAASEEASSLWRRLNRLKEAEAMEAVAQYDFQGRTERELSFHKGDQLSLHSQVSADWWEGTANGHSGLIPDKYIRFKMNTRSQKGDSEEDKLGSTESLPAQPLSIAESVDKSASQPNISLQGQPGEGKPKEGQPKEGQSREGQPRVEQPKNEQPRVGQSKEGQSKEAQPRKGQRREGSLPKEPGLAPQREEEEEEEEEVGEVEVRSDVRQTGEELSEVSSSSVGSEDGGARSTDELSHDIDTVLAEVMSGLQSLQMRQPAATPPLMHPVKNTPDLVQDLPVAPGRGGASHADSCAEMFANSTQSTMKKGSSMPRGATPAAMLRLDVAPMKRSQSTSAKLRAHMQPVRTRRERYSDPSDASLSEDDATATAGDAATDQPVWVGRTQLNDPLLREPGGAANVAAHLRPKPTVKVKPQLMKKPAKSPEILRRLRSKKEAHDADSAT